MAFKVWIDDGNVTTTNLLSESDFESNTDRASGFKSGSAASAKNVNSAVRQANLIAVALMQSMGITSLNLKSTVAQVKTEIDSYFKKKLDANGDASTVKVSFNQGTPGQLTSGKSLSQLFYTLSGWCANFGPLATKSTVGTSNIAGNAITMDKIADYSISTSKFAKGAVAPAAEKTSFSSDFKSATIDSSGHAAIASNVYKSSLFQISIVYTYTGDNQITKEHRQLLLMFASYQSFNAYEAFLGAYKRDDGDIDNLVLKAYYDGSQIAEYDDIHFKLAAYCNDQDTGAALLPKISIKSLNYRIIQ